MKSDAHIIPKNGQTVLTDPILLGRDELLVDVVSRVQAGRHVLLTGESGIGKSRLLDEVHAIARGKCVALHPAAAKKKRRRSLELKSDLFSPLWIKEATPMSSLLEELMFRLADAGALAMPGKEGTSYADPSTWPEACEHLTQKQIRKLYGNARDRRHAILHSLRRLRPAPLMFIDAVDRASPSMAAFLLALQKECTIATAVREVHPSQSLATFFKTFGAIKVDKLSSEAMRRCAGISSGRTTSRLLTRTTTKTKLSAGPTATRRRCGPSCTTEPRRGW